MKKIIYTCVLFAIFFGAYKWNENKQIKEALKSVQSMEFAQMEHMDQLSIKQFPEEKSYFTFNDEDLDRVSKELNKLNLSKVEQTVETTNYITILFQEDLGSGQYIEYVLYDNGNIEYTEGNLIGFKKIDYKVDEKQLKSAIQSILKNINLE